MKQHILRTVISGFLAFVLSLLLCGLVAATCLFHTIFDEQFVMNRLEQADFYEKTAATITDNMESLGIPGGIPAEVFDGFVTGEMVEKDVVNGITAAFEGNSSYQLNLTPIREELNQRFTAYAESQSITLTEEIQEGLNNLVEYCTTEYRQQVTIPFIETFGQIRMMFARGYNAGLVIGAILCVLLVVFLFSIRRYKHRALRFLVYSFWGGALMTGAFPAYVLIGKTYERIHLSPEHVYNAFVGLINTCIHSLLIGSVILFVIGVLLMIGVPFLKKWELNRKHRKTE